MYTKRTLFSVTLLLCLAVPSSLGCRLAFYFGSESAHVADIVSNPEHNLVRQSYLPPYIPGLEHGDGRNHETNLDGWGIGLFHADGDAGVGNSPRSIADQPRSISDPRVVAMNDRQVAPDNIGVCQQLEDATWSKPTPTICKCGNAVVDEQRDVHPMLKTVLDDPTMTSTAIFAHIRAKSDGEASIVNAHPFAWKGLVWMHNGAVHMFKHKREMIIEMLRPEVRELITGTTDSEHLFALFTNFLPQAKVFGPTAAEGALTEAEMVDAMVRTIDVVKEQSFQKHHPETGCGRMRSVASSINVVVSNGNSFVATRYRNCDSEQPPSLYLSQGSRWTGQTMVPQHGNGTVNAVILASEPLSRNVEEWELVGKDELVSGKVHPERGVALTRICLSSVCEGAFQTQDTKTSPELGNWESNLGTLVGVAFVVYFVRKTPRLRRAWKYAGVSTHLA